MGELDAAFGSRPSGKEATLGSIDIPAQGSNPVLKEKISTCAGESCAQKLPNDISDLPVLSKADAAKRRAEFGMDTSDVGQATRTPGGRAEDLHAKADSVGGKGFVPPTETAQNPGAKSPDAFKVETPKGLENLKDQYLQIISQIPDGPKRWKIKGEIEDRVELILNKGNGNIPPHIVSQAKSIVNSRGTGASDSAKK